MKISFIGGGNMASAILNGILCSGFTSADNITVSDFMPEKLSAFAEKGVNITSDNMVAAENADVILFAVKPDVLRKILPDFAHFENKLFISIAAGVKIAELKKGLGKNANVIRVMPNTPATVGEGMTVICESDAEKAHTDFAVSLFETTGKTLILNEKYIDAVTAVSGSGPAYIYMVIEAMADGGVLCGLPREAAYTLATQTVLGAAKTVLETGEHPGVLKDRVCSPGGTTIEAVYSLEQSDIRGAFIEAVKKCADKSKSM